MKIVLKFSNRHVILSIKLLLFVFILYNFISRFESVMCLQIMGLENSNDTRLREFSVLNIQDQLKYVSDKEYERIHWKKTTAKLNNSGNVKSKRYLRRISTKRPIMSWTPGVEVDRVTVLGKEIVFRVVQGRAAHLGDAPYQVAFRKPIARHPHVYATFCGGTIISPTEIISAAHCFHQYSMFDICFMDGRMEGKKIANIWAVAGTLSSFSLFHGDNEDPATHGHWRRLKRIRYPKEYKFPQSDITVVFVESGFAFNAYVKPMNYATHFEEYEKPCVLSGYGRISEEERSDILRIADIRTIPTEPCNHIHKSHMVHFVCTTDEVADIGKGDSGGPLVCPSQLRNGAPILVGVVSGKLKHRKRGSIHTRVASYHSFIEEVRNKAHSTLLCARVCLFVCAIKTFL